MRDRDFFELEDRVRKLTRRVETLERAALTPKEAEPGSMETVHETARELYQANQTATGMRECTCLGSCKGAAGLAPGWVCVIEADRAKRAAEPGPTCGTCNDTGTEYGDGYARPCPNCATRCLPPTGMPITVKRGDVIETTGDSRPRTDEPDFTVVSRRKIRIKREELCADCQRSFDLIEAQIISAGDRPYPCEECKDRLVALHPAPPASTGERR